MSGLSIETGTAAMGTHTMEVTVYHRRGSQSYVPLAHSSSAFIITGKDLGSANASPRAGEEGREAWLDLKGKGEIVYNLRGAEPGRPGQRNVGLGASEGMASQLGAGGYSCERRSGGPVVGLTFFCSNPRPGALLCERVPDAGLGWREQPLPEKSTSDLCHPAP